MTLGDAKRKVLMLLDEYSSGGAVTTDADINAKMADFFDMAQKEMAMVEKMTAYETIVRLTGQTQYTMPDTFRLLRRVWADGKNRTEKYRWRGKTITIPADDESLVIEVEYYKTPETITGSTSDTAELEVSEEAAVACCYYVASKQLIADLVMDYGALEALYQQQRQACERRAQNSQRRVTQGLFRRG